VLSDLQGKPCSRGYQGAGGRHELVILAKHHVEAVTLYLQPQRAAFRVVGAAVVGGRCYQHRPPAACLGAVQGATLHHTGALTPLRHAEEPQKARSLAEVLSHETRELYEPARRLPLHLGQTQAVVQTPGRVLSHRQCQTRHPSCPSLPVSICRASRRQGRSRSAVASGQP
jgi:hypothetical protein